jgi:hypothetical protein
MVIRGCRMIPLSVWGNDTVAAWNQMVRGSASRTGPTLRAVHLDLHYVINTVAGYTQSADRSVVGDELPPRPVQDLGTDRGSCHQHRSR